MSLTQRITPAFRLKIDRPAAEMAVLFLVVLIPTAWLAMLMANQAAAVGPPDAFGDGAQGEAAASVTWVIAEVAFAMLLLGGFFVYRKLPGEAQKFVRMNLLAAVFIYLGADGYEIGGFAGAGLYLGIFVTLYTLYKALEYLGVFWILNNVLSVVFAIIVGLTVGMIFGVVGVGIALVGLAIYDHAFANKKAWMFTLAKPLLSMKLPILFIRPDEWRFSWDEMAESFEISDGEDRLLDEDTRAWGLGTADLALPAAFVAAVAMSTGPVSELGTIAVVVVGAGIVGACFRLRYEMTTRGSGAGLPALTAGSIIPYAALALAAFAL